MTISKDILLERKSWLDDLQIKTQKMIDSIDIFGKIDITYTDELISKLEVEYQEQLIHLRACNNLKMVTNAKQIELPKFNIIKD
jgi:hypothetical protein